MRTLAGLKRQAPDLWAHTLHSVAWSGARHWFVTEHVNVLCYKCVAQAPPIVVCECYDTGAKTFGFPPENRQNQSLTIYHLSRVLTKMADLQEEEMFPNQVKVCIPLDGIEVVVGEASSLQEVWEIARQVGFLDGDNSGLVLLSPCLSGSKPSPVWRALVGQPLPPVVIQSICDSIADGATHIFLPDNCGRDITATPEPWGNFVRPVRVSYKEGFSRSARNTEEVWEFLKSKGISDNADLTVTVYCSESDSRSTSKAKKGMLLHTSIMLLLNAPAPEGLSNTTVRLDFKPPKNIGDISERDFAAALLRALAS